MTSFNRLPEKPNAPPSLHKLSNELAKIGVNYKSPDQLSIPAKSLRVHTPGQIKKIGRSLSVFGFLIPIVIDEAGCVLVGVGRLSAARDLGFTEVPTIQVTHLSEAQKKAFAIAENRLAEIGKWDDKVLAEQLAELSLINLDFDIEVTGFEVAEIDLRIESLNLDFDGPPDVVPELATGQPVSQVGDLWILGRHRVVCGSALDPAAYAVLMNTKRAARRTRNRPWRQPAPRIRDGGWGNDVVAVPDLPAQRLCSAGPPLHRRFDSFHLHGLAPFGGTARSRQFRLRRAQEHLRVGEAQWRHGLPLP
jgi:hypothetical protein